MTTLPTKTDKRAADSSERAYTTIKNMLIDFELRPEARINEVQLSRQLGLSRTPVREALNRLASDGFISLTPNRGFFVRSLSTDGLLDLYELRSIIECAAFTRMCERAEDAQIAELRDFWYGVRDDYESREPDDILALDEQFHMMIAEFSGNPEIANQLMSINQRIRFIRRIQVQHVNHTGSIVASHSQIVDAAQTRDIETGCEMLRSHIEITVSATQDALKDALMEVYGTNNAMKGWRREAGKTK
ncbi:GntR family transcriptional regulator [Roseovarius aestuarii]|nr:GntR family transcriptional regulator [Roseovarius aestuarii]